jgi:hypothetical protein
VPSACSDFFRLNAQRTLTTDVRREVIEASNACGPPAQSDGVARLLRRISEETPAGTVEGRHDEHTMDALALRADEGRGTAPISRGESQAGCDPRISEWGNPMTTVITRNAGGHPAN